jgi:hypothetical protein
VSYYCEEGNGTASGVFPTGEVLRDVSVNVTTAGVLSFSFTRALAAHAALAPRRPLGPDGLTAFPLAQLDGDSTLSLTAALFPSWSPSAESLGRPAPSDVHFVHTGASWTRTPPFITFDWASGQPTADSLAKIEEAKAVDNANGAACLKLLVTDDPLLLTVSNGIETAPSSSTDSSGGTSDSASGGGNGSSDMMGTMSAMRSSFFTSVTGWGAVLFPGALMETRSAFVIALLLSCLFAALTTLLAAAARPVELRGADASAHAAWVAAGFASTALRTGSHYVSMLLIMTFNVWIILAVLTGHAAGYLLLATAFRNGVLPAAWLHARAHGLGGDGGMDLGGAPDVASAPMAAAVAANGGGSKKGKARMMDGRALTGGACDCA